MFEILLVGICVTVLAVFAWIVDKKDSMYDDLEYYDNEEL